MASKKKGPKKYNFEHLKKSADKPKAQVQPSETESKTKISKSAQSSDNASYFAQDLKKVALVSTGFLAAVLFLYYIMGHTTYLNPVLKIFKLV